MRPPIASVLTMLSLLALAACTSGDLSVRSGPQAVHPSTSALSQRSFGAPALHNSAAKPVSASGVTEVRTLFDTYCTSGRSNNARVTEVIGSGRFEEMQIGKLPLAGYIGKLPLAGYEDMVFVFYKLRTGPAQIGFGARRGGGEYCVTVDGTATGNEYYITGP